MNAFILSLLLTMYVTMLQIPAPVNYDLELWEEFKPFLPLVTSCQGISLEPQKWNIFI